MRPVHQNHQVAAARGGQSGDTHDLPVSQRYRDALFRSLFARSGICIALLDRDLVLLDANTEWLTLLNRSARDVVGHPLGRLVHPRTRPEVLHGLRRLGQHAGGRLSARVVLVRRPDVALPGRLTALSPDGPPGTAPALVTLVTPDADAVTEEEPERLAGVDARILEGVAAGVPTSQLAAQLYLSRQGVEYHVSGMLRRFAVPNRAALVAKAYALGLFRIGDWPPRVVVDRVR